jgi:hypothetical protein
VLSPRERETLSVLLAKIVLGTFDWPAADDLLEATEPQRKAS